MSSNTYTPSVNIIRDAERELVYYPTPNAQRAVRQIESDFKKGNRSFNIIGSYGTGKSSFLWALEQTLRNKKRFFDINLISDPTVEIINFVGEYKSLIEAFADHFDIRDISSKKILSEIYNCYYDLGTRNAILIIVVDEFGKFLEYAAQNTPEKELYFIQQLTEFVNNSDENICLISTVHQNFDAYSFSLSDSQRKEWSKVKGRFREITFNEPVEQLLLLVAEHLEGNNNPVELKAISNIREAQRIALSTSALKIDKAVAPEIADRLYPLDLLSATVLTLALQRYGQNERSLFSFLQSTDHTGLSKVRITKNNPFYNVANIYDYLTFNFYSFLNSKDNPDYLAWMGMRSALENVERSFVENLDGYEKLIKVIGLLSLVMPKSAVLDQSFLVKYGEVCLGLADVSPMIASLTQRKIILYRIHNARFVPNEGTDLDIQLALRKAGNDVDEIRDVTTLLQRHYQLPPVLAKMYSYQNGTPRSFQYWISEKPISTVPKGEIDGYLNLIFRKSLSIDDVKIFSSTQHEAIVYVYYQNTAQIREQLFEIEKTQKVIDRNPDDKVAIRELNNVMDHQKNLLNHYILDGHFRNEVTWIFKGESKEVFSQRDLNKLLSQVCYNVYSDTPKFKNELVNRHKISASIGSAKKMFLQRLVSQWNEPDLGFEKDRFPPEKTIYLTLIKENGLNLNLEDADNIPVIGENSSFKPLWNSSIKFLAESKQSKQSVAEFIETLSKRPFKLKQGLIDFWVPTFLFLTRNDFALFEEGTYVPDISSDILELIVKNPQKYDVKAFDLDGVKLDLFNSYRHLLSQGSQLHFSNKVFIETVKPFLKFYRDLPEYAKNTKRLSKEAIAVREAIINSKEPEKTFFEDFPQALGYSFGSILTTKEHFQAYISHLQEAIREIRTCYDNLVSRFEEFIINEFIGEEIEFEDYKLRLQSRYKNLKRHMLLANQKAFIQRLDSQLDDRKAWLNSMAQAVIGKSLDIFRDNDELQLYDKLRRTVRDLDNLTTISEKEWDGEKEEVFSLEISSFVDGISTDLVRMPASKRKQVLQVEKFIREQLQVGDDVVNIAALTNILKELLRK
ncbi:hypothetical protein [Dyadobacter luticola]|nr:hypothetical protein [Dyadobacter luticola]